MAQAPAVPKFRRGLRRLAAFFRGPAPNTSGLLPSERAALNLAQTRRGEHWSSPAEVIFLIPLVGPDNVQDWTRVDALLSKTLDFFLRQKDPRWRAVICCQQRPTLPEDNRISHIPFVETTAGNDKWRKLHALYSHLPNVAQKPGLAMTFDGDDLAGPDLVSELLARPSGTLVQEGLVYDAGAHRLAQAQPQSVLQPGGKAFWKLCGSCAAQPFDPEQHSYQAQIAYLCEMSQHEHRMIPYLAALAGHHLQPLRGQEVLYLLNHGENFGARRGRVSFKTRFVERFELRDTATKEKALALYEL